MNYKLPTRNEIEHIHKAVLNSPLLRLLTFSYLVSRYIHIKLGGRLSWLRNYALIWLVANDGSMTPSQLARILLQSNHDITRLVTGLEKDGLVMREHSIEDRRVVNIKVTQSGLNNLMQIIENKKTVEEKVMSCLDESEIDNLRIIIRKLRTVLTENN